MRFYLHTVFLIVFALLEILRRRLAAILLHCRILLGTDGLVVRAVHVGGGEHGAMAWIGQNVGGVYWAVLGFLRFDV